MIPADHNELFAWTLAITAGYVVMGYLLELIRMRRVGKPLGRSLGGGVKRVFDGLTLAVSLLLLMGVVYPSVMELIGDTRLFAIVAGLAGVLYSLHALVPEDVA
ncbi:hypothetical protein [Salinarimonas ramus]|uniref:Uncharacterized protein n=1 Tax=Salinarimonas ramus TaxID=690164 RepID=A0A917QB91_9HYPH|nr:hypothetical protein [Salinarimonas ramus]GGK42014.1 hypothetical protein GCM10011322_31400 [Salinarimonas ramus]